jgi:uncharacterized protein (DUF427 family)
MNRADGASWTRGGAVEDSGFLARPDYRVDILARRNRVTASFDGEVLADSVRTLLVDEQDHGLVFYFPPDDVRLDRFVDDDRTSRCPYKGTATYRRLEHPATEVLVWSYEDPYPEVVRLAGFVAFYQDVVDLQVGVSDPPVSGR